MQAALLVTLALVVLVVGIFATAIRIVREYERVVVFRFGRLVGCRGPGLVIIWPLIERTNTVSLRVETADIQPQDIITKDNVTVRVEAAVFFKVVDSAKAVVEIYDYRLAVLRIAQTTLRAALSRHELDDLLANQESVTEQLKTMIDEATETWGVQVVAVEMKDIDLPESMQRAMARQAEAERERRAKIIAAEGEFQAAERLAAAAGIIGRESGAMTLRTLQTLSEVAAEQNSTLIFPIPIELFEAMGKKLAV
ncbi:MAG: slipin family protein [Thermoleophilaceae bacterium]|nr:slipin family protein [Thermoleophilaceae bacterium]